MTDIIIFFRYGQLIYIQAFAGICQTWGLGCLADLAGLEKLDPFIQIVHRQLIKVVHAEQIILREYVSGFAISLAPLRDFITEEEFTLSVREFQDIIRLMQSLEHRLAMIYIILSLSQCEIHDIDGIYLAHLVVIIAQTNIVCDDLGNSIEHTVEIGMFPSILYLEDDEFSLLIFCQDINSVEFIILGLLIALTIQESVDLEFLVQQRTHKAFQHGIVCLVAKQALHRPVKSDIICHILPPFINIQLQSYDFILRHQSFFVFFLLITRALASKILFL